jgi:hypothetical protein
MARREARLDPRRQGAGLTVGDTYDSAADADADRAQQKALLAALGGWDRALRRDECGAWCIMGTRGKVYTWGDGQTWVLWVGCRSARHWTSTKQRLDFCQVTQDCDEEGCLRLHAQPTAEQAITIRDVLGIRKRAEVSPETLERLKAQLAPWSGAKARAKADLEV